MSDENIQSSNLNTSDDIIQPSALTRQVLLSNAFLTDKTIWKQDRDRMLVGLEDARKNLVEATDKLKDAYWKVVNESKIIQFVFNVILRRPSPAQKKFDELEQKHIENVELVNKFNNTLEEIVSREPNPDIYELAMLGNNIFKPR